MKNWPTKAVLIKQTRVIHRTLNLWGSNIQRKLDHVCLLNMFLIWYFELIWQDVAVSDQTQLFATHLQKKSALHVIFIFQLWDIELSGILHNKIYKFARHGIWNAKLSIIIIFFLDCFHKKQYKMPFFVLFAQIWAKKNFLQKLVFLLQAK